MNSKSNRLCCKSFGFLILLFTGILPIGLLAQTKPSSIIAGKIFDSETGNPLENAIVFLANTPIGTSSANDGTFRIPIVPVGAFQMIIARVGYERELVDLNVTKAESLYYEIRLRPRPVRTGGVEVYAVRPAELKPSPNLFLPKESPNTYCFFGTGSSMPIGVFFTDSALYMYSPDTAVVDTEKYIRLWLLYKNLSQTPYELNPIKCMKLHMRSKGYSFKDISPDISSELFETMNNDQIVKNIVEKIGADLQKGSTIQKTVEKNNSSFQSKPLRHLKLDWEKSLGVGNPVVVNTIFEDSKNVGILKKYLVGPGASVNGYIYFAFPGLNWKATASGFPEAAEYAYTIEIITQSGSKFIEFVPH